MSTTENTATPAAEAGTSAAASDAPASHSLSFSNFARSAAGAPTSPVAPARAPAAPPTPPPDGAAEPTSDPSDRPATAREKLTLRQRERFLAAKQQLLQDAEAQLDPQARAQLAIEANARDAARYVKDRPGRYPITNAIGAQGAVAAYQQKVFLATGKLLPFEQIADAIEQQYAKVHTTVADAVRRAAPVAPAPQVRPRQSADRPIDDRERWKRAMAALEAVTKRRKP